VSGASANQAACVAEAIAGNVIYWDSTTSLGFSDSIGASSVAADGPARRVAVKTGRRAGSKLARQRGALVIADRAGEAHVIEQP